MIPLALSEDKHTSLRHQDIWKDETHGSSRLLKDIIEGLELQSDEGKSYPNTTTGEVVYISGNAEEHIGS